MSNTPYICADCFHQQNSMDRPCDRCKSFRVVLKSVVPMELLEKAGVPVDKPKLAEPFFKYHTMWYRKDKDGGLHLDIQWPPICNKETTNNG